MKTAWMFVREIALMVKEVLTPSNWRRMTQAERREYFSGGPEHEGP